jgi:hypothetical protein
VKRFRELWQALFGELPPSNVRPDVVSVPMRGLTETLRENRVMWDAIRMADGLLSAGKPEEAQRQLRLTIHAVRVPGEATIWD